MLRGTGRAGLVAFDPPCARSEFEQWAPGFDVVEQPEGDLGVRILHAMESARGRGERVVLIGSDTPQMPATVLDEAYRCMEDTDLVIGPAIDGGFYLIGAKVELPRSIFNGVEWSTSSVRRRVLENALRLGLKVACLRPMADIDDAASLALVRDDVLRCAPRTADAMRRLGLAGDGHA
jgi:glycosyltransferase A (GT-A) superfamily protein (DUF2064 family)